MNSTTPADKMVADIRRMRRAAPYRPIAPLTNADLGERDDHEGDGMTPDQRVRAEHDRRLRLPGSDPESLP